MAEVKVLQLQQPPVAGASQDAHSSGLISYLAKKKKGLETTNCTQISSTNHNITFSLVMQQQ